MEPVTEEERVSLSTPLLLSASRIEQLFRDENFHILHIPQLKQIFRFLKLRSKYWNPHLRRVPALKPDLIKAIKDAIHYIPAKTAATVTSEKKDTKTEKKENEKRSSIPNINALALSPGYQNGRSPFLPHPPVIHRATLLFPLKTATIQWMEPLNNPIKNAVYHLRLFALEPWNRYIHWYPSIYIHCENQFIPSPLRPRLSYAQKSKPPYEPFAPLDITKWVKPSGNNRFTIVSATNCSLFQQLAVSSLLITLEILVLKSIDQVVSYAKEMNQMNEMEKSGIKETEDDKNNTKMPLSISCAFCNEKKENLLRCSRCKQCWYCSSDHQLKHWINHSKECKPWKEKEKEVKQQKEKEEKDKEDTKVKERKRKLAAFQDDDIQEAESVLPLTCPISIDRIRTPAQGRFCNHLRCFDLQTFIEISELNGYWQCPICFVPLPFQDILIDPLVTELLQTTASSVTEIHLNNVNGQLVASSSSNSSSVNKKKARSIDETPISVDEIDTTSTTQTQPQSNATANVTPITTVQTNTNPNLTIVSISSDDES